MKASEEFKDILKVHNELQVRLERAEELHEKDPEKFKQYEKLYGELLLKQCANFDRLYKIFAKSDIDYKINSNKILQVSDFEVCRVL